MSIFKQQPQTDGVDIYSFAVNDEGSVQITYAIKSETNRGVVEMHTVIGPSESITNLQEIMEDLNDALDSVLVYRRNPPAVT